MRGKSLRAAEIYDEFTSFLDEITPRPELIQRIGELVVRRAEQDEQNVSKQRQRRRERILQLEKELKELIRMRAQNLISDEEFVY